MRNTIKILVLGWLGSAATAAHALTNCRNVSTLEFGPDAADPVCVPATSDVGMMLLVVMMLALLGYLTWRRAGATSWAAVPAPGIGSR